MDSEYPMPETGEFYCTPEIRESFDRNGYILVRGLLSNAEVAKLKTYMEHSDDILKHAHGRSDGAGKESKLSLWNYAGDDICGIVARSQKVAGTLQELLGGDEIYHYHSKLMMKDPKVGGAHIWHQDYGYWYHNGCLLPEMGSIFIPVDKCTKTNSCLQVLKGSHKMGRIDHNLIGTQAGAESGRLEEAKKVFEHVYVEMEPGDALFFHCNLLHGSDQNHSELRRWVLIISMNKRKNNPTKVHHHALYNPLKIVPNSAIMECNTTRSSTEQWFMDLKEDNSAQSNKAPGEEN